ncbi:MAG TPA: type II toxin-antitoxin system VapC family toxin [Verrucomicrobiota bacterium]|nr:type II toxin-antitoxin system VapC family toxin [Verrucomicrobiota bacterium]HNU51859.1 type II toxin-antitoxin system VapC family toxin [Verrucomicrobiota bacterium]
MNAEAYVDTGIMVKSYVLESDSPAAIVILEAAGDPLVFSHVHALEVPNAIRLKRFRGEITAAEEAAAIRALRADVDVGRLVRPDYDLAAVFIRADGLSGKHSSGIGSRSLDLLHVAVALAAGCTAFASFDTRQRKLAALAGLRLIPAKYGARS